MDALTFLKGKFPLWGGQDHGAGNIVSLSEDDLIEAMEEYAALKNEEEELQQCEGCDGKWPYDKMKADADDLPLCENCFDALQKEAATWKCKKCNRKGSEFKEDEHWVDTDFCSTCEENDELLNNK